MKSYQDYIKELDNKSIDELMKINSNVIKSFINEFGKNNSFMIRDEFRKGNKFNSIVTGAYLLNNKVYIKLYIQNSHTDCDFSTLFDKFFVYGKYTSSVNDLHERIDYSIEDKAEIAKSFYKQYYWLKYSDEARKKEIIDKLTHYSILNPITDYFYDKYDIRHKNPTKYSSKNDAAIYEGYMYAKKELREYIEDNYIEFNNKSNEELNDIFKKEFDKYIIEFGKTFDFNEWKKKRYYI